MRGLRSRYRVYSPRPLGRQLRSASVRGVSHQVAPKFRALSVVKDPVSAAGTNYAREVVSSSRTVAGLTCQFT